MYQFKHQITENKSTRFFHVDKVMSCGEQTFSFPYCIGVDKRDNYFTVIESVEDTEDVM